MADTGNRLAPGASLPPLVLDDDEAVALVVGLQAAAQTAVTGMAEASARYPRPGAATETPIRTPLPPSRRPAATPSGWSSPTPRRTESARSGSSNPSVSSPWAGAGTGGLRRRFRLDRLTEPRSTGARFAPRPLPADDPAAFVRAGIDTRRPTYAVEVVVVAPAAEVRLRIGQWATVEENGAGSCRVRMEPDDLSWPAMALGTAGAEFTVVSPPELCDLLRDWGARFGRAAAGTAPAA